MIIKNETVILTVGKFIMIYRQTSNRYIPNIISVAYGIYNKTVH